MPRILIADDNSNIQKMVTLALHGAGIEVVSVSNGGAAIRSLPETLPDLVLADVFMPVRSGYEVCDFIKHDTRFSHVPVVLLVGAFDPLDEAEAQRVSADGILKKPFIPPDPLINLVKALLSKAFHERPEATPVPVAVHAGQHAAPQEIGHSAEAPAAAFSEPLADEFAPAVLEPDFGGEDETLAFSSLLEMPAPAETSAEPRAAWPSPAAWGQGGAAAPPLEEEDPDAPRAPGERGFLGADFPELDEIAPPENSVDQVFHAAVADEPPGALAGNGPEDVADLDAQLGFETGPDLGEKLDAALEGEPASEECGPDTEFHPDVSSAASFDPVGDTEAETLPEPAAAEPQPWAKPWAELWAKPLESAAPPASLEPPAAPEAAGALEEDMAEGAETGLAEAEVSRAEAAESEAPAPETAENAAEFFSPGEASPGGAPPSWAQNPEEVPAAWVAPAPLVFPGSDKLWAAAPPAPTEARQAPAEEATKEIPGLAGAERQPETETNTNTEPVAEIRSNFWVGEIELPTPNEESPEESLDEPRVDESGIAEQVAHLLPVAPLAEIAATAVTSAPELEPHELELQSAAKPAEASTVQPATPRAPDPELIEAVVTRIVERMQPKVIEVVTREILRPLVEALVRREINRSS